MSADIDIREREAREVLRAAAGLLSDAYVVSTRGDTSELSRIGAEGYSVVEDLAQQSWGINRESRVILARSVMKFFLCAEFSIEVIEEVKKDGLCTQQDFEGALLAGWAYPEVLTATRILFMLDRAAEYDKSDEPRVAHQDWYYEFVSCLVGGQAINRLMTNDPHLAVSRPGIEAALLRVSEGVQETTGEVVDDIESSLSLLRGDTVGAAQ